MKFNKIVLALAAASVFAVSPAFAEGDDAQIYTLTELYNGIAVLGYVDVSGEISVGSESAATVDQDQDTWGNSSFGDGDNDAHMTDNALKGAEGNIGVNVAAGDDILAGDVTEQRDLGLDLGRELAVSAAQ